MNTVKYPPVKGDICEPDSLTVSSPLCEYASRQREPCLGVTSDGPQTPLLLLPPALAGGDSSAIADLRVTRVQ